MGLLNDGRSKKRGRNYFKEVTLNKPENTTRPCCVVCGKWPAAKRWYAGNKPLCDDDAKPFFETFLKTLAAGCIVLFLCSILILMNTSKAKHKAESRNQGIELKINN